MLLDKILVVDDEPVGLQYLRETLAADGLAPLPARDAEEALELLRREAPDAVITDYRLTGRDGLELLREIKREAPGTPVVLVSAHGEVASAVEAMRDGAEDFLTKPFSPDELRAAVARMEETLRLREENHHLRREARGEPELDRTYEASPSLAPLLERARRVAATKATVLIDGETGTGKELLARYIHENSERRDRPYVRVNCAALSPSLLESEMFGHERGAFTGAVQRRMGRFELADGGTLLLDEIGEVPLDLQTKLLRVLEEEEFERVGGSRTRRVDLRVLATTNRDLREAVAEGAFREDLFYRLNIVPLTLPPLRLRRQDIPSLVRHFLARYRSEYRGMVREVSAEAMELFREYAWPGNIRELRNVIQRIAVLTTTEVLEAGPLREWLLGATSRGEDLRRLVGMSLAEVEKEVILRTLEETRQNKTEAARILGLTPRTLFNKLKLYRREDESSSTKTKQESAT